MADTLKCIKCERGMENISSGCHQPNEGLGFHTRGHYGSAYFDPMDGSYLEISVCDECVKAADEKGLVGHGDPDPRYSWFEL
ncbi:hypothetical protein [Rhizobium sp.]|uniref:hypothetical protein n=1 Tax=Rhizobium sp. TaxID=391 RepID=UPI003F7F1653